MDEWSSLVRRLVSPTFAGTAIGNLKSAAGQIKLETHV